MTNNDEHATLVKSINQRTDRKIANQKKWFKTALNEFKGELMEDLKPLFEDFTGRNWAAKNKQGIVIDPSILQVIKWLVAAVLILVGGAKYLG